MQQPNQRLQPQTVLVMTIISAFVVANLYYNQPLLAEMERSFNTDPRHIGWIPTLTQVGYAVGLLFFVPLGDLLERRKLIVGMLVVTALALAATAVSPSLIWLIGASLAIGLTTIVAQLILPFAAYLAQPYERGKVVGTIMSGIFIGILLARTVSGAIGAVFGWREMYWIASGLMIILAFAAAALLPRSQPTNQMSYGNLMQSLIGLIQSQPVLREASIIGALSFAAFSAFWSTLVFLLEDPPYKHGSEVAGLFGLVGVVGALAAPLVGRIADKRSPRLTVGLGVLISTSAFLILDVFGYYLWGLTIGVILLDLGVQSTQVSNQARIYSLPEEFHSRLNTVYMVSYFIGGAIGSALGAFGWGMDEWQGVCRVGLMLLLAAIAVFWRGRKRQPAP